VSTPARAPARAGFVSGQGGGPRLAGLVANHSAARFVAELRGLGDEVAAGSFLVRALDAGAPDARRGAVRRTELRLAVAAALRDQAC
jgi:hypothetical protein